MNIQIKTSAIEIEVTGDQGEVVFSHKAENIDTFVNAAALMGNLASLAALFRKLDHEVDIDNTRKGVDAELARKQAESVLR